ALRDLLAQRDEWRRARLGREVGGADHGRGDGAGQRGRVARGVRRDGGRRLQGRRALRRRGRDGGGRLRGGGCLHDDGGRVLDDAHGQAVILAIFAGDLQFGQFAAVQQIGQRLDEGDV